MSLNIKLELIKSNYSNKEMPTQENISHRLAEIRMQAEMIRYKARMPGADFKVFEAEINFLHRQLDNLAKESIVGMLVQLFGHDPESGSSSWTALPR